MFQEWTTAEPILVLLGLIVVPALIVFGVVTYFRMKRSSFRSGRTSRSGSRRRSR
jgi:ABC-type sulfate transport system permease subunit